MAIGEKEVVEEISRLKKELSLSVGRNIIFKDKLRILDEANTDLRAKLAECEKDAARYRWLRNQHQGVATKVDAEWFEYTEPTEYAWTVFHPTTEFQWEPVSCIPGELDAAIDVELAKLNAYKTGG